MKLNVAKEVAALERMSPGRLREKYAEVFGERTNTGNKIWLVRRIIWRMQAKVEGGLSERARLRAEGCPDHASVEPRTRYPERDSVLAASGARAQSNHLAGYAAPRCDRRLVQATSILVKAVGRNGAHEMIQVRQLRSDLTYTLCPWSEMVLSIHPRKFRSHLSEIAPVLDRPSPLSFQTSSPSFQGNARCDTIFLLTMFWRR
jgi:hypothetical protein